jgi:hypothetical protein
MRPSGEQRRVLADVPEDNAFVTLHADGASLMAAVPFATQSMVRCSADGSRCAVISAKVTGASTTYLVTVLSSAGDTAFSRTYTFPGAPIPADSIERAIDRTLRGGRYAAATAAALRRQMTERVPHVRSPLIQVVLGGDSTTWLVISTAQDRTSAVLLGATGEREQTISLPPRFRLVQATRDVLWGLEHDDDGLASVVRYRIRR